MNLKDRLKVLEWLYSYLGTTSEDLQEVTEKANYYNSWFTADFTRLSLQNIREQYLEPRGITEVVERYHIPDDTPSPLSIGLVMAGNIPLVGFHDLLSVFLSGHRQVVKLSSRDNVLIRHLVDKMVEQDVAVSQHISFADTLKGCDAYIATGSNNSARYFEQYFARFPHIIRKNRTGIAILDGTESAEELDLLADDIQLYFGLGCRNITQVWVPENYEFAPLLRSLDRYEYFMDNHKYKHNYDYALTISMMNREAFFTNGSIVISPGNSPYSGIANLKYATYRHVDDVIAQLNPDEIQVITGHGFTPFGTAQCPGFFDFADGIDTMKFLVSLNGN